MTLSVAPQRQIKLWRRIVFAVVVVILAGLAAVFMGGVPSLLSPWTLLGEAATKTYHPEIHRWHDAIWGTFMGIVFTGSMLTLIWSGQKRPILAQIVLIGVILVLLVPIFFSPTFDPGQLIPQVVAVLVVMAVFALAYPKPGELVNFSREGSVSKLLLALSILAAVVLAPDVWRNVALQITDKTSEHALEMHWITTAAVDILLVVAGFMAASKRYGWRVLGIIVGLAFLYLGAAAVTVPYHPGSWGTIGGSLAIVGGLGYIVSTVYEMRRTTNTVASAVPELNVQV